MGNKKDIPLHVLRTIEPFLERGNEYIRIVEPGESLFRMEDVDQNSNFYFEIKNYQINAGKTALNLDYKPKNSLDVENYTPKIAATNLKDHVDRWGKFIEEYDSVKTIYDDPILKDYEDKFYSDFDIIDDDADIKPFELKQQILIDKYLSESTKKLETLSENGTEEEKKEISFLIEEANEIRTFISKETKKKIIKRLSKFFAKSQKAGLHILKEVLIDLSVEAAKKLLMGV